MSSQNRLSNAPHNDTTAHRHLKLIRQAALDAADAELAVHRNLELLPDALSVGRKRIDLHPEGRIRMIAIGKASRSMSRAAEAVLGAKLSAGLAAVPRDDSKPPLEKIETIPAGHPLPDLGSLSAGKRAAELVQGSRREDLLLTLISGGGSAMLELPLAGISLEDLQTLNLLLLNSGAPIEDVNTVRKAVSRIKGGGLARLSAPARVVSLILSDVVGDRLSAIASGPTVLSSGSREARSKASAVLEKYELWEKTPSNVRRELQREPAPHRPARRPINVIIGSNRMVVHAAKQKALGLGYDAQVLTYQMRGEARDIGAKFGRRLNRASPGTCLLMGGETTVTVVGDGLGGRNQELALAAAFHLESKPDAALMSLATDGVDGPTDAAGAVVNGETILKARRLGLDPEQALERNDSYPILKDVGALIQTGPTGTNLMDLVVGLKLP
jgi:glycerate 2-kinase